MLTDEDGCAVLVLPAGDFELAAHAPDGGVGAATLRIVSDADDQRVVELTTGHESDSPDATQDG